MSLQNVRGTHDLLPEECARHRMIIDKAFATSTLYGFEEMATPILESSEVFKRTLGDASDIVSKEMYTFEDRGGDSVTLRPEGTAGVARAFLSNGLMQKMPIKFFYHGPMFRYERPQKGRQRQFHQLGVEILGVANSWADIECIALADTILKQLEVRKLSKLEINSIGDSASRTQYRSALVNYLTQFEAQLSQDSQKRLKTNPLRILDSKDAKDQEVLKNAPLLKDHLNEESQKRFKEVTNGLEKLGVEFTINPFLVRGLDYYSHSVFEFKTDALGAQDAILSGGRYDALVETMGGPATPGIGWAAGIERLSLLCPLKPKSVASVAVIPVHGDVEAEAFALAKNLRDEGLAAEVDFSGNMSKRMKKANQRGAWAAVILGPDEIKAGTCMVKNLSNGTQESVRISDLASSLRKQKPVIHY
jgi:histidyl-tRNA synthetase